MKYYNDDPATTTMQAFIISYSNIYNLIINEWLKAKYRRGEGIEKEDYNVFGPTVFRFWDGRVL